MDNFYKLTFKDYEGDTHIEYYNPKFPHSWFYAESHISFGFLELEDNAIAIDDLNGFVDRIICDGLSHRGEIEHTTYFTEVIDKALNEIHELGEYVEFAINDGWLKAEVVEPPEIDVKATLCCNDWSVSDRRCIRVNGKCLAEEKHLYYGKWFSSDPWIETDKALEKLVKSKHPGILSLSSRQDDTALRVKFVAENVSVIEAVLAEVFDCTLTEPITPNFFYGKDGEITRVKYTAVFDNH